MAHATETSSSFMINPKEALPLFTFFVVCWLTTTKLSQTITISSAEINDAKPFVCLLPRTHKNRYLECKEIGNKFRNQFNWHFQWKNPYSNRYILFVEITFFQLTVSNVPNEDIQDEIWILDNFNW